MAAYFIVDVDVKNPQAYEAYKQAAAASIAQYGGRYLVRGGRHEVLEGTWRPTRLVVLEFPTIEAATRWYTSAEYGKASPSGCSMPKDIWCWWKGSNGKCRGGPRGFRSHRAGTDPRVAAVRAAWSTGSRYPTGLFAGARRP